MNMRVGSENQISFTLVSFQADKNGFQFIFQLQNIHYLILNNFQAYVKKGRIRAY